ncbi:MAG: hypothetical protein ACXIUM_08615 [Wenzhouxiangella sp.]
MSRLTDLLRQVESKDARLADDLRRDCAQLSKRRAFELNFERHGPETVERPRRPVRKGDELRLLPERARSGAGLDRRLWQVSGYRNEAIEEVDPALDPVRAIRQYLILKSFKSLYPKAHLWLAVS